MGNLDKLCWFGQQIFEFVLTRAEKSFLIIHSTFSQAAGLDSTPVQFSP